MSTSVASVFGATEMIICRVGSVLVVTQSDTLLYSTVSCLYSMCVQTLNGDGIYSPFTVCSNG